MSGRAFGNLVNLEDLQGNQVARLQLYKDFKSAAAKISKDADIDSKSLEELGRAANFLARLSHHCEDFPDFASKLANLIKWCVSCYLESCTAPQPLYFLCKAYVVLNDTGAQEFDMISLELFMEVQDVKDENLKKFVRDHIIYSIRSLKERSRTQNHEEFKNILCRLLQDDGDQGMGSLIILCSLYKDKIWVDKITESAICDACLHKSPKIRQAAVNRLLALSGEPQLAPLLEEDMCELQRQDTRTSSSPLAFVDKKEFGKKLRFSLEVGEHFEVMPWKLYVRTLGPNSILNLFDEYLQKYTTSNLEDVTELLLTSFRAGLDSVIDSKSLESLMRIQTLANEELMDLVRKHVRDCICSETDKRAQKKLKKTLLGMLEVDAQAEGSLEVLCSLYKTQFRSDLKIANAICHASLNGSPKVKHAASLFLLGFNIKDKETDDDMPNEIELQLQASFSPIAIIKKKDFGKKLKSQLLNCHQSDVLRLCKLYVWTVGPDSILKLFTRYLESLIESELAEEVIKLLLTSFRAGLDKGINSKSLQSFLEIQSLPNEDLRDLVRKHIVDCICDLEDKQAQRELKETLLRMLTVKQLDAKTEGSLAVLCSLYQSKCWCDTEMANAICSACFNGSAKIAKAASSFILEIDKADSSKILGEMPKAKLLTHLKECNQPEEKIILLKVLALMVETPVISEVAIRDLYVKLTSNQEEVAELFAAALKDYHVKKPVEAQALFKQTVVCFFERKTTRKSKAAGLLFIQKVCISEQLLIYEDLKNSILTVKQYYENILKGGIKKNAGDVAKYIESAQDLIHLIEQLGSESALRQSSKRKRQSKKKPPAQKGTG